ncbi:MULTISPECIES: Wzz/FepE/Etk N-terminal domain-containing protein [Acidobacteriaceae]|uniref:Wzz/FepE/Etk N-terminal domain-containing protein n=1 Tax=Acidobacteriaceae TaxID=204434 RepID=UPI00131B56B5|nr:MULTISPECIES: Wzz/FepE/Etk N-terminal domain-containing protein [Acidobacteriaceae]MDW5265938.1 GNVR domain-containing protein [Edaphobacter sp.]
MSSLQQRTPAPTPSKSRLAIRLIERRWMIGACLTLGWGAGIVAAHSVPHKYRSETVILIEQQKVPNYLVEPNISADIQQQRLQSIREQMLSRTGLLALIQKFHLYGNEADYRDPDGLAERMRKDIKIELIEEAGKRELAAFQVSYSASDPTTAKEVTNELATQFISETIQDRKRLSEDTTSFLESQLEEARQSLATQEEKLREFRTQSSGELPEQIQSNLQILAGLQNQLQDANDALSHTQQHDIYLRSLYRQYQATGTPTASGISPAQALDAQVNTLKAQLVELEARYTDSYPEIIAVKQQIAKLEAQQAKVASLRPSTPATPTPGSGSVSPRAVPDSPLMIQINSELSADALQSASEKEKLHSIEKQIGVYQSRLNAAPDNEQKAAAVNRDYDQSRTYYESLLNKKLQSEMATELEGHTEGEQFRVIDPANLPIKPYWPNEVVFSSAGLAGGLAIGLAIALLLGALNPYIYEASELSECIGSGYILPLPSMATPRELAQMRRRKVLEVTIAIILAITIPAITLLRYYKS